MKAFMILIGYNRIFYNIIYVTEFYNRINENMKWLKIYTKWME